MGSGMPEDDSNPVWIDNPRVDSYTMLEVYKTFARPEHPWYGLLTLEQHEHNVNIGIPAAYVPASYLEVKCTDASCFRCEIKKGGFKFRWLHSMWVADYDRRKAHGAWSPYETQEETARLDDEWRQRHAEHQQRVRQQMDEFNRQLAAAGGSMRKHLMNLLGQKENDRR